MATAPITSVQNPATATVVNTPAFVVNNPQKATLDSSPNANLDVFANPVQGFTDTGVTHSGDLGGAG